MNKKNMVIGGLALGIMGGATVYFMANKKARRKAQKFAKVAYEDATNYFDKMDN